MISIPKLAARREVASSCLLAVSESGLLGTGMSGASRLGMRDERPIKALEVPTAWAPVYAAAASGADLQQATPNQDVFDHSTANAAQRKRAFRGPEPWIEPS